MGKPFIFPKVGATPIRPDQIQNPGGAHTIQSVSAGDWFSPLAPLRPMAPADTPARRNAYPMGVNLQNSPKNDEAVDMQLLRDFADAWDILILVRETKKDQIARVPWEIRKKRQPGQSKKDLAKANAEDQTVTALNQFFASPDGRQPFGRWMREGLEDLFVLDAWALYMERDKSNNIASLMNIDGGLVVRKVDEQGLTPPPPSVAYQTVPYGFPDKEYTTDDMLYSMYNPRTHRLYGFSPVQQMMRTILLALKREDSRIQYYTSGNMPEALVGLANSITPDQVEELQLKFDSWSGNLAERRKVRFVPTMTDDGKLNIVFPKDAVLKDELDNWLAQVACYCFGVSSQALQKQMNRASAEQNQEASEEEGLMPWLNFLADVLNVIIQQKMGFTDYEFSWQQRQETDALKEAQINDIKVKSGRMTINEWREVDGEDPFDSSQFPEADMPLIYTATGPVPLSAEQAAERSQVLTPPQLQEDPDPDKDPDPNAKKDDKEKPTEKTTEKSAKSTHGHLHQARRGQAEPGYTRRRTSR